MADAGTGRHIDDYVARQSASILMHGAEPYFLEGDSQTAFLVLHGWSASAESVRFLSAGLWAAGHSVLAPTLPGHGTSTEEMVKVGPVEWVDEARAAAQLLRRTYRSVFVLGVSMGGALALQLAGGAADQFDGVITLNAPVFMGSAALAREILMAPTNAPLAGWPSPAFFGPEVDEISYPQRSKKSGADLYAMCSMAREILPLITCPLLVIQSVKDPIVPKASADEIVAGCASSNKRAIWLENSFHASQLDLDRDLVVSAALEFVGRLHPLRNGADGSVNAGAEVEV